jgi:hypothetical protein
MVVKKQKEEVVQEILQEKRETRGWLFSVIFLFSIILLILFLAMYRFEETNREVLIGLFGILFGNIPAMVIIASGRSPEEIDELKSELAKSDGDRQALISRLRDSQIQLQLARQQTFELQTAVIEELSILKGKKAIKSVDESDVLLPSIVDEWGPKR